MTKAFITIGWILRQQKKHTTHCIAFYIILLLFCDIILIWTETWQCIQQIAWGWASTVKIQVFSPRIYLLDLYYWYEVKRIFRTHFSCIHVWSLTFWQIHSDVPLEKHLESNIVLGFRKWKKKTKTINAWYFHKIKFDKMNTRQSILSFSWNIT